jgi:hypothetical protein
LSKRGCCQREAVVEEKLLSKEAVVKERLGEARNTDAKIR